jgi:hypothetical protein
LSASSAAIAPPERRQNTFRHAAAGMGANEADAGQFNDLGLGDLGIEAPVEIGEYLHDGEADLTD